MQLRLQLGTVGVLASKNPFFEDTFFQQVLQRGCDIFEMLPSFVFDPSLGMASVISGESITSSPAGQRMEQVFPLSQFAQAQIEDARPVAVDEHDAQQRGSTQKVGNRPKMKMAIDEKLGPRK